PRANRAGLDVKVAKALDTLARRLGVGVADLKRTLRQLQRPSRPRAAEPAPAPAGAVPGPVRAADLDPIEREMGGLARNEPTAGGHRITRVTSASLCDAPLRMILQACYDLYGEGQVPSFDRVVLRLDDPAVKALASGLAQPADPLPLPEKVRPAPWPERLDG